MADEKINERAQRLLKGLVERYIREGQPVGSRTLLADSGLPISAATVRNIMAELEEKGYVNSPHTSAGRVPTARGYRFFVDSLIMVEPLEQSTLRGLEDALVAGKSPTELVATASRLLSTITSQAGLVTIPRQDRLSLRQVEFLPLSGNRVLVILVMHECDVQNRVIHTHREYSEQELRQAANFINRRFAGRDLDSVRTGILQAMHDDREVIDRYLRATLDLASRAFDRSDGERPDYVLAGEKQLIEAAEPERLEKLRDLFDAFERKKDILDLVDRCIRAQGVKVFIGEESGYEVLDDFSVVTAPYRFQGQPLGVLGVIGPTRMSYERVIPIVDVTARMLSLALNPS